MTEVGRDTIPAGGRPSPKGVAILALCALALVATSPPPPFIDGRAIGEVVLGGGATADRVLRIHLEETPSAPTRGTIGVTLQAASGLDMGYDPAVAVTIRPATDEDPPLEPGTLPVERCTAGCDLEYHVRVRGPSLLPASVVRYVVDVRFEFRGYGPTSSQLHLDLEGAASGPVTPIWSLLAGLLALVAGIAGGPAVDRALGSRGRRWPAWGLTGLTLIPVAWLLLPGVPLVVGLGARAFELLTDPRYLFGVLDPWSTGLLLVLAWGTWRGRRRWPVDGGWMLGISAVATTGLGGLWLAWWLTRSPVVQPVALAMPFVALGGLGGLVMGQAWRIDPAARHDRWWTAFAVLAHGVIIAGFGFLALSPRLAVSPRSDAVGWSPTSLLALVPALLVALAFHRWLRSRRRWLVAFDALIAIVGLLGIWLWTAIPGAAGDGRQLALADVAIGIAVAASLVAFVTSLHSMHGDVPGAASGAVEPPAPAAAAAPVDDPAPPYPTAEGAGGPPTT